VKILIVEPETLQDYTDEDNWYGYHELIHEMQRGGFIK
jgi:hypothetical protein